VNGVTVKELDPERMSLEHSNVRREFNPRGLSGAGSLTAVCTNAW